MAVALAAAVRLTLPDASVDPEAEGISDAEVLEITRTHCASCHSERPTNPAFPVAPKNMVLATYVAGRLA